MTIPKLPGYGAGRQINPERNARTATEPKDCMLRQSKQEEKYVGVNRAGDPIERESKRHRVRMCKLCWQPTTENCRYFFVDGMRRDVQLTNPIVKPTGKKARKAAFRKIYYSVEGTWPFPTDMLRYDNAKPIGRVSRERVERLSKEHADSRDDIRNPQRVDLVSEQRPHAARWASFGWRIITEPWCFEHPRAPSDEEIRKQALAKLTDEEKRVLGL